MKPDNPAIAPPPPPFAARNLSCRRGDRLLFAGLDFCLESGAVLYLVGPNGSGKSSLLRLMAGLSRPFDGAFRWGDQPVEADRDAHTERLAFLGHQDGIKPQLTVRESLRFHARLHGSPVAEDRLAASLAHFGLTALADSPGRWLSAGQRKRAALARLLVVERDLWLLDEPSVGLDEAGVTALRVATERHCAQGRRAVIATHVSFGLDGARLDLSDFAVSGEAA